ncbi:hypothetical protein QAD02_008618 [Eretmocerus hayati]|uniref:Uncharacterized protein n=1 Tax=Eretmocerus hayati TaxID=131215 RepID=A0ACC2N8D1_9HYME|nr:hypothetical protein QAD02_008618 [Eretmocerus hayati]
MEFKPSGETSLNSYFEDYMNYNSFYSDGQARSAYLKSKTNLKPVSELRQILPQIFAVLIINICSFDLGLSIGFIREMFIHTIEGKTKDFSKELVLMSSITLITGAIGYLISGPIVQNTGRQRVLLIVSVFRTTLWLFTIRANKILTQMLCLGSFGLTGALMHGPIMMYVAEISRPRIRGVLLVIFPMAVSFGILCESGFTRFEIADKKTVGLASSGCSLFSFVLLLCIPESPHWLASTGQIERLEQALCWLRGWVEPDAVRSEVRHLCKIFAMRGYPAGVQPTISENEELTRDELSRIWRLYSGRSFWIPFLLSFIATIVKVFGGSCMTQMLVPILSSELRFPLERDLSAVVVGLLEIVVNVIGMCVIYFFGRRKLIVSSMSILTISQITLSIYIFIMNKDSHGENFGFIGVFLMLIITSFSQLGIVLVPYLFTSEIFPIETRGLGIGLVNATSLVIILFSIKIFIYLMSHIGDSTTHLCFAVMNIVGCIILYFNLPETDGKSLIEIKKFFADERRQQSKIQKISVGPIHHVDLCQHQATKKNIFSRKFG